MRKQQTGLYFETGTCKESERVLQQRDKSRAVRSREATSLRGLVNDP